MTDTQTDDAYAYFTVADPEWQCRLCGQVAAGSGDTKEGASYARRKVWFAHGPRCLLAAIIHAGWRAGICGERAPASQLAGWVADEHAERAVAGAYRDIAVDTTRGERIIIDMEKKSQSTAGNNILSQTEHDAALSHVQCWWQCTPDKTPVARALSWLADNPAGTTLTQDAIDQVFGDMFRTPIDPGREAEAKRLERSIAVLLGVQTQAPAE